MHDSAKDCGKPSKNQCVKGTMYNTIGKRCVACATGRYTDKNFRHWCNKCPGTQTTSTSSAPQFHDQRSDCKGLALVTANDCVAGFRYTITHTGNRQGQINGNHKGCVPCGINTYSAKAGQTKCTKCPKGKITTTVNAGWARNNAKDCVTAVAKQCKGGWFFSARAKKCVVCAAGTYSTGSGKTKCTKCPFGTSTTTVDNPLLHDS